MLRTRHPTLSERVDDCERLVAPGTPLESSRRPRTVHAYIEGILKICVLHTKKLLLFLFIAVLAFIFLQVWSCLRIEWLPRKTDGHLAKPPSEQWKSASKESSQTPIYQPIAPADQPLHILIPATKSDPNLCKLLFSASILDYPPPVIVAWDQTIDPDKQEGLWGGGTHLFKISKVLEWLQNLSPDHDDDLVMMMDGYDIWFQLRKDLLVERYYQINAEANARIQKRMGRAAEIEGIKQTIIFGSGKRCFPNEIHTIACWPLPPSPLPKDMWDGNTDGTIGSYPNAWAATRQKFLNSGIIIGPAKDMRALFARAAEKVEALGEDPEPDDNGSRWSEKVYHSSDQSVFNMIFGEQEYQREVMRIRHMSWIFNPISKLQQLLGKDLSDTDETLEGNQIVNILDPPWSHALVDHLAGTSLQYGIGLDYWSSLSFQTANSERNGAWMKYNEPLDPQVQATSRWDCKPHLHQNLPADLLSSPPPLVSEEPSDPSTPDSDSAHLTPSSWTAVLLYTNICAGTVPVMVHLNGDKNQRDTEWHNMWYQPHAEKLIKATPPREGEALVKGGPEGKQMVNAGGAFTDTGNLLPFEELCHDWDFS
ncbi:MAG: hypothetical protein Q9163_000398 [Psora crenata]